MSTSLGMPSILHSRTINVPVRSDEPALRTWQPECHRVGTSQLVVKNPSHRFSRPYQYITIILGVLVQKNYSTVYQQSFDFNSCLILRVVCRKQCWTFRFSAIKQTSMRPDPSSINFPKLYLTT